MVSPERIVLRLRQNLGEVDRTWRNVLALRSKLRPLVLDREVLDAEIFMGAQQGPVVMSSLRIQSSRPDPPATPCWTLALQVYYNYLTTVRSLS